VVIGGIISALDGVGIFFAPANPSRAIFFCGDLEWNSRESSNGYVVNKPQRRVRGTDCACELLKAESAPMYKTKACGKCEMPAPGHELKALVLNGSLKHSEDISNTEELAQRVLQEMRAHKVSSGMRRFISLCRCRVESKSGRIMAREVLGIIARQDVH